jgi:uncharacterized protein (DUF111 family)
MEKITKNQDGTVSVPKPATFEIVNPKELKIKIDSINSQIENIASNSQRLIKNLSDEVKLSQDKLDSILAQIPDVLVNI